MVHGPKRVTKKIRCSSIPIQLQYRLPRFLLAALLVMLLGFAGAEPASAQAGSVSRDVLAVYDGRNDSDLAYIELHRSVQTVLEHLGLKVTFLNLADEPLPSPEMMRRYRGSVIQLWSADLPDAEAFLEWVRREIKSGRRMVLLGGLGPDTDRKTNKPVSPELLQSYTAELGFEFSSFYTATPALLSYGASNSPAVDYERRRPVFPPLHPGYKANSLDHEVLVSVRRKNNPQSDCPVVSLTPYGGVAWEPYYLYRRPDSDFSQWYIDPFYFFGRAFQTGELPKPDVSTISGRRVWYNHIDGDALLSLSHIKKGRTCGAVLRDEFLKKQKLPFTVSVITCEVDPKALGSQKVVDLARSIFALPNVEPASHTYSHPFNWEQALASAKQDGVKADKSKLPYGHYIKVPGYSFSLEQEIKGSAGYINQNLAPEGKSCQVLLWSGNCRPQAEAIAMAEELGMAQMNGGDTIFDNMRPSLTGVAPLVLPVGDRFQVYTSMANENIYTNLWTGPFWGQRRVVQTFERTGSPRRLRPINLYFHFYAGERLAALNALKYAIKWARNQPASPVYASQYYRLVQGFLSSRFSRLPDGGWIIEDHGELGSIRFDNKPGFVDLQRSKNVQGFNHYADSLYVHIGAGPAEIYLTDHPPAAPYLAEASGRVVDFRARPGKVSFVYRGWGSGPVVLAGVAPGVNPQVSGAGWLAAGPADAEGRLELTGPAGVAVSVSW